MAITKIGSFYDIEWKLTWNCESRCEENAMVHDEVLLLSGPCLFLTDVRNCRRHHNLMSADLQLTSSRLPDRDKKRESIKNSKVGLLLVHCNTVSIRNHSKTSNDQTFTQKVVVETFMYLNEFSIIRERLVSFCSSGVKSSDFSTRYYIPVFIIKLK